MPDPFLLQPAVEHPAADAGVTHVVPHRRLARLLAFAGRSIDEVVNCGMAKRELVHFFKTERAMHRRFEVLELECQWNPLGRSA